SLRLGNDYFHRLQNLPVSTIHVLVAEADETDVAAGVFFTWKRRLHYHLSGATELGRELQATNALIWHAVESLLQPPFTLHLGGGLEDNDSLARYKRSASSSKFDMCLAENVVNIDIYRQLADASQST